MSLFGDDDEGNSSFPTSRHMKSSLFDDDTPSTPARNTTASQNTSSIFADSAAESPWDFTPKRTPGRGDLVKTLLANADVPELYIDTFDSLQSSGQVKASEARELLSDSGIGAPESKKIWSIVSSKSEVNSLGRGEFNVLLALIGLAQEGEELSLDSVDERRHQLPTPALPASRTAMAKPAEQPQQTSGAAQQSNGHGKPSFGAGLGEPDPWNSPEMHKGHGHSHGNGAGQRTTSTFTTSASETNESTGGYSNGQTAAGGGSWGASTYGADSTPDFGGASGAPSEGAGFGGDDGNGSGTVRRPAAPRVITSKGVEEVVTVNLLDEKEGMFMFQHRNYEVASVRRNSKVIRRYSDFVWLLDCLHKRYPFRQLPLLPPKRVAINGNHIAADTTFLEKRRRGLVRFANALVRHPVLREEQLVVMFLTVPTVDELAVWRKQATISVQEEFVGRALPPGLEDSLPQNLSDTFETVRSGVRRSADLYINLCSITERLCKRKDAFAAEYGRMALSLNSVAESTNDTFNIDTNEVPLLNEGIKGTAKHLGTAQSLLEDEARAWDEGLLEDHKTVRDTLVSVRDMFDRRDRYAKDNIPALEKRIAQNEQKLANIRAKGDAAKPGEAEKVENAITADKQSIVDQHARGVFIKECIRDEIYYFQNLQHRITRLHQDWAQERIKYAELHADNDRAHADSVDGMPQGE